MKTLNIAKFLIIENTNDVLISANLPSIQTIKIEGKDGKDSEGQNQVTFGDNAVTSRNPDDLILNNVKLTNLPTNLGFKIISIFSSNLTSGVKLETAQNEVSIKSSNIENIFQLGLVEPRNGKLTFADNEIKSYCKSDQSTKCFINNPEVYRNNSIFCRCRANCKNNKQGNKTKCCLS